MTTSNKTASILTTGRLAIAATVTAWLTTGCSPAEFKMYEDQVSKVNNGLGNVNENPVICDPFDVGNIVPPTAGLKGSIAYLTSGQPRYQKSTEILDKGTKVNAELFLNKVDVPEREWTAGFSTDAGVGIKDNAGNLLTEWFAVGLESNLKLDAGEGPGQYQLAVISDDGSTLSLQNSGGVFEAIVPHEGDHSTVMGCASKVIPMAADTRVPLKFTYYQGPRNRISAIIMWRKIPAGGSLSEVECGKGGNDYFFVAGTNTTAATNRSPYNGLLSRGWKPLSTGNFELKSGSNKCSI